VKTPHTTNIQASEPPLIGSVLQSLRQSRGLSLEDLSRRAGVSKSMLSQIERNQANPTVALVWRLANALGVSISDLINDGARHAPAIAITPAHAIPSLKSPDGKCDLKILGPLETAGQFEWYELTIEPGGILESQPHESGAMEHLTVFDGLLEVRADTERRDVRPGETARYAVDTPHAIRNIGDTRAHAMLIVLHAS